MIDPRKQPMVGEINFSYDASIFDGDPDDKFELAQLEYQEVVDEVLEAIERIVGPTTRFTLSINPE